MLSLFDADLARRDPGLPGLATLLDVPAIVALLRDRFPEIEIKSVRNAYLRYKQGTNCLALYELQSGGRRSWFYAKTYPVDIAEKLTKPIQRSSVRGPLGDGIHVWNDPPIVLYTYPNDAKLKHLRHLGGSARCDGIFKQIGLVSSRFQDCLIEPLRYKPERRLVAKLLLDGVPRALLKCYTDAGYSSAGLKWKAFRSSGNLRIPARIARSNRLKLLAFEWLPGTVLQHSIHSPTFDPGVLGYVGKALAELHAQHPEGIPSLSRETEIKRLLSHANHLNFLLPGRRRGIRKLARNLAMRLSDTPQLLSPIHGDFYAAQVLIDRDQFAILDLDEAVYGDPASDLGNFVAHLEAESQDAPAGFPEACMESLTQAYCSCGNQVSQERLNLYTAIGLFRIAGEPFRMRRADWPERMEWLLERVEHYWKRIPEGKSIGFRSPAAPVPVIDPFNVVNDPAMPFLSGALDPMQVQFSFGRHVPFGNVRLCRISVTRHKPGRRCLVEYEVDAQRGEGATERYTLIGKSRAKGFNRPVYELLEALREAGWNEESPDGVAVPEVLGAIPEFHMYLQRKVSGVVAGKVLTSHSGVQQSRQIAELIHKLHGMHFPIERVHTLEDELRILRDRLAAVAADVPSLSERLDRLFKNCARTARGLLSDRLSLIHRDFYQDQVLFSNERLYLLDLDLFCLGDPALDAGNFLGHVTEQALRMYGSADSLRECETAFENRFVELTGESVRPAVRMYAVLSLARHISLSRQFPDRTHLTEILLDLCEARLAERNELLFSGRKES